ncbi:transposase [uncultured Ilyobacter sp.]|uniref:transposase n=1 Tax=uncultured Ilyobacter sp. TaxID=544433 RepID=UPI0029F5060B|nr:transposase [uncultured Ilyobacter sp.]
MFRAWSFIIFSKDKIYRFLSSGEFCEKNFWLTIKPMLRSIQNNNACISVDDTIIEKPHTKENEVVSYCYDHTKSKCVKGINLLSMTYKTNDASLPINHRIIRKDEILTDSSSDKVKRKSVLTKNQHFRNMLKSSKANKVKYRYVLADSWFSSNENFKCIHKDLDKCFVFAVKSNRLFKLTGEDDSQYRKLSSFDFQPETA